MLTFRHGRTRESPAGPHQALLRVGGGCSGEAEDSGDGARTVRARRPLRDQRAGHRKGIGVHQPGPLQALPEQGRLWPATCSNAVISNSRSWFERDRVGATFAAKQRAVIDAYLAALDRDANSVLYVQDGLRHFWPQMPDRVRRHSIVGDVRRLLEMGRAEGRVTDDIDIDLLTTAWLGHAAAVRAVPLLRRIQATGWSTGGRDSTGC